MPRELIAAGRLGEITNYRGRFFSMYGSDPLGLLSWRFLQDEGGHGVTSDLLSHAVDLAHDAARPDHAASVGTTHTYITRAACPAAPAMPRTTAAARRATRPAR